MLGGMMSVYFMHALGLGEPAAVVLAVLGATMVGALVERLAIRPVRDCPAINLIIITIGVSILIRGLAMLLWGKDTHVLEPSPATSPSCFSARPSCCRPFGCWS